MSGRRRPDRRERRGAARARGGPRARAPRAGAPASPSPVLAAVPRGIGGPRRSTRCRLPSAIRMRMSTRSRPALGPLHEVVLAAEDIELGGASAGRPPALRGPARAASRAAACDRQAAPHGGGGARRPGGPGDAPGDRRASRRARRPRVREGPPALASRPGRRRSPPARGRRQGTAGRRRRTRCGWRRPAEPLLQEPIEGEAMAITGVYDRDARPVALCCDADAPLGAAAQSSCRAETVPLDDELAERSRAPARRPRMERRRQRAVRAPAGDARASSTSTAGSTEPRAYAAGVNVPDLWVRTRPRRVGRRARDRPAGRAVRGVRGRCRARGKERRGGLARDLADVAWSALRAPQWRHALRDPAPATNALSERAPARASTVIPTRRVGVGEGPSAGQADGETGLR